MGAGAAFCVHYMARDAGKKEARTELLRMCDAMFETTFSAGEEDRKLSERDWNIYTWLKLNAD